MNMFMYFVFLSDFTKILLKHMDFKWGKMLCGQQKRNPNWLRIEKKYVQRCYCKLGAHAIHHI